MLRGSKGRGHSPHLIDIKITTKWLFFSWNSIFRITEGKQECWVEKNISQQKQEPATNMATPPGRKTSTLVTATENHSPTAQQPSPALCYPLDSLR